MGEPAARSIFCTLSPLNARLATLHIELLPDQRFRFGRHPECEQAFPSDRRISSLHASLLLSTTPSGEPCIAIEDSSVNGTFVNAERVPKGSLRPLTTGDELYLVIPSQEALHRTGYDGSLMGNFIGYSFAYISEEELPGQARLSGAVAGGAPLEAMGETEPTSTSDAESAMEQMKAAVREVREASQSGSPGAAPLGVRPPPIAVDSPGSETVSSRRLSSQPVGGRATDLTDGALVPAAKSLGSPVARRVRELAARQFEISSALATKGAAALGADAPRADVVGALGTSGELPPAVSFALWWANHKAVEAARPPWKVDASDLQARYLLASPWHIGGRPEPT